MERVLHDDPGDDGEAGGSGEGALVVPELLQVHAVLLDLLPEGEGLLQEVPRSVELGNTLNAVGPSLCERAVKLIALRC